MIDANDFINQVEKNAPRPVTERELEQIKSLLENFPTDVPLHPDLVPHVKQMKTFEMIHHPLVVSAPYGAYLNKHLNEMYERKKKALFECVLQKNWSKYIWLHERPYRLEAFCNIYPDLVKEPENYWNLLHDIWIDCEAPHINKPMWTNLFNANIPNRNEYIMRLDDLLEYDKLPNMVTVYRGYDNAKHKSGISYTLDIDTATWFSKRFGKKGGVITATVPKKDIILYSNGRSEQEVVITKRIKFKDL